MPTAPQIQRRSAQPYVAIRRLVTMETIPEIADRLPEIFAWLGARGIEPAGPPFLRYRVIDVGSEIDADRHLDMDAGVPVASLVEGDGNVITGTLPGGKYATVTHVGPFGRLATVTADLLDWAARAGLSWDMTETENGQEWGCRLEFYKTDPTAEPDMGKWETELAFRLADA